ncbi:MAG: tRNA (guanosine(46)-N7)-methyltransferase TrmB [Myxococcota bacterium]|nr:tRNA (guanosine(46)-N7)-methyltransferase TrmB [Myxococcota bacterium]
MPRIRGHLKEKPSGEHEWPILNGLLFGDQEIGGHDVAVRTEVLPLDWAEIFGRSAQLSIEIGFNRGRFLTALAQARPAEDFVGIEIRRRYCWRLAHLMAKDGQRPGNLRLIWADAKAVSRVIFGSRVLDNIYITFPDPWWKKRHAKRRLVDTKFAVELASLLKPGGRIWVKTDVRDLGEEIKEALAAVSHLGAPIEFLADALPLTHRETNCMRDELPIERFYVERISS